MIGRSGNFYCKKSLRPYAPPESAQRDRRRGYNKRRSFARLCSRLAAVAPPYNVAR